jgi:DNA polymerase-3 subunit alpha
VVLQGRADFQDDGVKVLADKIWPLDTYEPEYYLLLKAEQNTVELQQQLRELFAAHPGRSMVHLRFGRQWQPLPDELRLATDDVTVQALQTLVGKEAVKLR